MKSILSPLTQRFNEPETLRMAKMARELRSQGKQVIDLSIGEPDFNAPDHIKEAAIQAINDNYSHYTPVSGFGDLRQAICDKFKKENDLEYSPKNIIVSTGAKQSIANLILSLVGEDDEVIIPTPYWVTYSEIVRLAGGRVKFISTKKENNFKVSAQELDEAISADTKLIMFSSPCNPTGAFYSKSELEALAKVFERYPDTFIMSDEIYEHINYVGKHESIAQFDNIKDRVVIINGMSKGFALTGWRIGYLAGNEEIVKACEKIQGQMTSGANAVAQRASLAALTHSLEPTYEMVKEFKARREIIVNFFASFSEIIATKPEGAFYIFPDVSYYLGKKTPQGDTLNSVDDLSLYLLNHCYVSSVAGTSFGEPKCIRFSYANSQENINIALKRIKEALSKLK